MPHPLLAAAPLPLAQATEGAAAPFGLGHMLASMGPFAVAVAAVLFLMSVYSLGVMAERLVTFRRAQRASRAFAEQLRELLPAARLGEAVDLSRTLRHGHLARVLGVALEEYRSGLEVRRAGGAEAAGFDVIAAVNRAVDRSALRTVNELRRGLGSLATIGSTAPFVGLLGTVAGIISAFQAMAATGSGGLATVSDGIAEALVTTAFGLLVAIPAVMMFNFLTGRVEDMQVDITDSASELVDYFMKGRTSDR
jgi:biopolymer transport protein ExbB